MQILLLSIALIWALFGHVALCLVLINRTLATGILTRTGKRVFSFTAIPPAALPYLATCWLTAFAVTIDWGRRQAAGSCPDSLRSDRRRVFRLLQNPAVSGCEDREHHFLVRLPGNQILDLDVVERGLDLRGLPAALDRFTVLHLSDMHFTGRVAKAYFEEVARICNDLAPDLVAITGDLIDTPACLDWIPDTLGRLRSRYGCFFVLGNHDVEVGAQALREHLEQAGLVDLGGRWVELAVGKERIVLAGNELPWLPPAADFGQAPPPSRSGGPLRIALSHSPDQFPWAQRNEVDLLLAGHLHGGQIRIPLVGPIVSPSRHGVRHASGVFHSPPTIMHVSRGVSAEIPLRLNCRPEVAKLTLHAGCLSASE
jgi:predicted MPP superfamily phosphohydrolase